MCALIELFLRIGVALVFLALFCLALVYLLGGWLVLSDCDSYIFLKFIGRVDASGSSTESIC